MKKQKKFKLNIKSKKAVIVLFALAVVFLIGLTANIAKDLKPEAETYDVFVRFNTVSCNGTTETFDTFKKECEKGERVRITLPEKSGYVAMSQDGTVLDNVLTLTAKTDLSYTINYYCAADDIEYSLIDYPVDGDPGMCFAVCQCGCSWDYEFTSLTQTIYFGGESLLGITGYDIANDGYVISGSNAYLYLKKDDCHEFMNIEEGCISILSNNELNPKINITLEYDESVWGENAISFKRNLNDVADTKYSISVGNAHRIIFKIENWDEHPSWLEIVNCENCPLVTSPIKIIVTCDFT